MQSSGIIAVKNTIRESGRKRFTVAHEIGHRVLHGASSACSAADIANWSENAKQAEKEAYEFAAELLLPAGEIAPTINSLSPSLNVIQTVALQISARACPVPAPAIECRSLPRKASSCCHADADPAPLDRYPAASVRLVSKSLRIVL
jgi:Zn-dependent peptidase ImmA (M78 family)